MFPNVAFKSDTARILEHLGLEKDYKDRVKTEYGSLIIERLSTKETFEVPYVYVEQIKKHRGIEQKILLQNFKKLILSFETSQKKPNS